MSLRARTTQRAITTEEAYKKVNKQRPSFRERVVAKNQSLLWIAAAVVVASYADLLGALRGDGLHWPSFGLAIAAFSLTLATFIYLNFYVPKVHGIAVDYKQWQVAAPRAIPFATAAGVAGSVLLTLALWPVYGILTPPILFVQFMAFIVALSLL